MNNNRPVLAPVLFVGHGSPVFALEPGQAGANLAAFGAAFSDLRAVLVISPHWMTRGLELTAAAQPETIHDFGGFPEPLYRLRYDAPGAPEVAAEVGEVLKAAGYESTLNPSRGRDHGAWVPMMHLLPAANVPVLQLSLSVRLNPEALVALGQALKPLRERGIAIVASGSLTHNLYEIQRDGAEPVAYAERFQAWTRNQVRSRDIDALTRANELSPDFASSHPTAEHYLPLLIAMGATGEEDALQVLESEVLYGVLSMESYGWTGQQATPS